MFGDWGWKAWIFSFIDAATTHTSANLGTSRILVKIKTTEVFKRVTVHQRTASTSPNLGIRENSSQVRWHTH